MIECGKCGARYSTERLFCGKCGDKLGIRCRICGFINLLDDVFCGICRFELSDKAHVSDTQEYIKTGSRSRPVYEEIRIGAEEDEAFAHVDGKMSQEEIEDIFQRNQES